jgi:hypothetical protein
MNSKKIGDLTVNDGKGLYDNEGLCDTLIKDMNNLLKQLFSGQYLAACNVITQITQKLVNLKKGIKTDTDSLKNNIEDLKKQNAELNRMLSEQKKDGVESE